MLNKDIKNKILEALEQQPVIAAVHNREDMEKVLFSPANIVFIVEGDFFQYIPCIEKLSSHGKFVFIHMDLIEGIGKDPSALAFIKDKTAVSGIISTKAHLLKNASAQGLLTIQRIFLFDTNSIKSGIKMSEASTPDFVECLPALMPGVISELTESLKVPVICGGLVKEKSHIINALRAGAVAVSASNPQLWDL